MDKQSAQLRARAQLLPSMMKGLLLGLTLKPTLPLRFSLVQFGAQFLTVSFLWFKNLLFNISIVITELKPSLFPASFQVKKLTINLIWL